MCGCVDVNCVTSMSSKYQFWLQCYCAQHKLDQMPIADDLSAARKLIHDSRAKQQDVFFFKTKVSCCDGRFIDTTNEADFILGYELGESVHNGHYASITVKLLQGQTICHCEENGFVFACDGMHLFPTKCIGHDRDTQTLLRYYIDGTVYIVLGYITNDLWRERFTNYPLAINKRLLVTNGCVEPYYDGCHEFFITCPALDTHRAFDWSMRDHIEEQDDTMLVDASIDVFRKYLPKLTCGHEKNVVAFLLDKFFDTDSRQSSRSVLKKLEITTAQRPELLDNVYLSYSAVEYIRHYKGFDCADDFHWFLDLHASLSDLDRGFRLI